MKIETTPDKVLISSEEVQAVLKKYVEEATGRHVDGKIKFSSIGRGVMEGEITAYCQLLSEAKARGEA